MEDTSWAYRLERDGVLIEWEDIGEGISGDFDPDDPDDEALLRFYISRRDADGEWESVDDASYCTNVPVETDPETLHKLLELLMDRVYSRVSSGESVKKLCEELSWIDPGWAK